MKILSVKNEISSPRCTNWRVTVRMGPFWDRRTEVFWEIGCEWRRESDGGRVSTEISNRCHEAVRDAKEAGKRKLALARFKMAHALRDERSA